MKICLEAAEVTCFSGSGQLTYTRPHSQTNLDPSPLLPFCYLFFCWGLGRGNCSTVFSVFDSRNSELAFRCTTWKRGTVLFAHINTKSKSHTHTPTWWWREHNDMDKVGLFNWLRPNCPLDSGLHDRVCTQTHTRQQQQFGHRWCCNRQIRLCLVHSLKVACRFWKNKPNVSPNRCYTFTRSGTVSSSCCRSLITEKISLWANHPLTPPLGSGKDPTHVWKAKCSKAKFKRRKTGLEKNAEETNWALWRRKKADEKQGSENNK